MAGSAPLEFPVSIDDRISVMYQLLLSFEEKRINFQRFCINFIESPDRSFNSYIKNLSKAVIRPLIRELNYKLDEILNSKHVRIYIYNICL